MQHCNEFLPLLSGHLDGMNSEKEEARLLAHLKQCRHCRTLLEQMEAADAALRDDACAPPVDLTARIMEQVHREPRKRRFGRRIFTVSAAGLAAAAMLALVLNGKIPLLSLGEKSADLAGYADYEMQADAPVPAVTDEMLDGEKKALMWWRNSDDADDNGAASPEDSASAPTVETAPTELVGNAANPSEETQPATAEPTEAETPLTEAETQPTEPCTSAAPACSEAPSEEPPSFSEPQPPSEPVDNGAANGAAPDSLPKRGKRRPLADYPDAQQYYPTLVIWNATVDCLDGISGLAQNIPDSSARVPSENGQSAQNNDRTLGKRFFSALPPIGVGVESTTLPRFVVSSYTTGSSVMESLLAKFKGTYELALYYPSQLPQQDICTVLLVTVIPPSSDTQNAETTASENPVANNVISNGRNAGVSLPSVPNAPATD